MKTVRRSVDVPPIRRGSGIAVSSARSCVRCGMSRALYGMPGAASARKDAQSPARGSKSTRLSLQHKEDGLDRDAWENAQIRVHSDAMIKALRCNAIGDAAIAEMIGRRDKQPWVTYPVAAGRPRPITSLRVMRPVIMRLALVGRFEARHLGCAS
jgi:hypothetical protein